MRAKLATLFPVVLAMACVPDAPSEQCDPVSPTFISDLGISQRGDATLTDADGGTWGVPLAVRLQANCLRGSVQVNATTTAGRFAGGTPATPTTLWLAHLGDGSFEGPVDLQIPADTQTRVQVDLDTASASSVISVNDAGEVTIDGGTPQLF
ncbi:hypothetical protein G4177_24650 [Corallococcus sp. ZKHCc1 1396]|uniref:Uncharacterized protein n=1 Tax=Corallococcus soli TaxID=2710757 RepID=A0ABR9PTW5_9BACT|nr:hypothetical protein [Corallococcus soli]MBE4751369.1 hypothetical protein [Corallococcus soli]